MANKTIPELLETTSPNSTDSLIIHSAGITKRIKVENILPEVSDTDTIDFSVNKTNRTITGNVKSGSITNSKLADVPGLTIKGRKESVSGAVQDLTLPEVQSLLGTIGGVADLAVRALTGNWESTYTLVCANSADWLTGGTDLEVRALTGNWQSTYTLVCANSADWSSSGAAGGGNDKIFFLNGQTVTSSYTIPLSNNAGSFGPITIASGVSVTIPNGSTWTVV